MFFYMMRQFVYFKGFFTLYSRNIYVSHMTIKLFKNFFYTVKREEKIKSTWSKKIARLWLFFFNEQQQSRNKFFFLMINYTILVSCLSGEHTKEKKNKNK